MAMSTGTIPIVRYAATANTPASVFARKSRRCSVKATAATATSSSGRALHCTASESRRDYYTVLSLEHPADVGAEDIKRAYRRLALRHHPDVCPPSRRSESTELFLELRQAYETLSDPARRVRYDAGLRTGAEASNPRGAAFARNVWESQLSVLRARSEQRQRARSSRSTRSDWVRAA